MVKVLNRGANLAGGKYKHYHLSRAVLVDMLYLVDKHPDLLKDYISTALAERGEDKRVKGA